MSNGPLDELMALADKPEELSNRAMQRMILTLLKETYQQTASIKYNLESVSERLGQVEENQSDYPTMLWLLRNKTRAFITFLILFLLLAEAVFTIFPWQYVLTLAGIPIP